MKGQINYEDGMLGKHIVNIAKRADVKTVVEVGTWNGLGSTRCVLFGCSNKHDYSFKSYECCKEKYEEAIKNNEEKLCDEFQIIYGKLVSELTITDWFDKDTLSEEQKKWLQQDLEWMKKAPNVLSTVPTHIDLLILDGGEFSTYKEWQILKDRVHYIVLDDTNCLKTQKIRQEIIDDNNVVIADDLYERNGYFVGRLT